MVVQRSEGFVLRRGVAIGDRKGEQAKYRKLFIS
jgi:hypothetical protein